MWKIWKFKKKRCPRVSWCVTKNGNFNVSQSKSEIRKGPTSENQVCACWLPCRFLRENAWTNLHCPRKERKREGQSGTDFVWSTFAVWTRCLTNQRQQSCGTTPMSVFHWTGWCQQHCAKRPNKNAKESALQLVALSQRWKADQHSQFFKQKNRNTQTTFVDDNSHRNNNNERQEKKETDELRS